VRTTLTQIDRIFKLPEVVASLEADLASDDTNLLEFHHT
jgi:hypothetical protein